MPITTPPLSVLLRSVPAHKQRYATVGDWQTVAGRTTITVSDTGHPDDAFLVAIHELVEWYLCQKAGVTEQQVDAFDMQPLREGYDEHGDDPTAPYHRQHEIAGVVERLVAHELGIDWKDYGDRIDAAYEAARKDK
jgi:hypothetical protein